MGSWQQTATFLAFVLVVGVIVFAGRHNHAVTAPSETALVAARK